MSRVDQELYGSVMDSESLIITPTATGGKDGQQIDCRSRDSSVTEIHEPRTVTSTPLFSVAIGQLIALLIVGTGASTTLLEHYSKMHAPAAQNAPNYLLLSLFLLRPLRRQVWWSETSASSSMLTLFSSRHWQEDRHSPLPTGAGDSPLADSAPTTSGESVENPAAKVGAGEDHWWRYALLSVVDVEANVLCVWAYRYTSITSAMLLDCFTIPCVMVLSCALLGAKYQVAHYLGALLCFGGIALIVTSDIMDEERSGGSGDTYPDAWLGDLMCVCGAFLYAVSNVTQERWVRAAGPPRFLGRLGACGAVLSTLQAALFEREALLSDTHWCGAGLGAWAGYTAALTAAYVVTSWFLVDADAALFNLSLLTADVYAVVFAYFVQGNLVSVLYAPAFCFTMAGIFVYHRAPKPTFSLNHTAGLATAGSPMHASETAAEAAASPGQGAASTESPDDGAAQDLG